MMNNMTYAHDNLQGDLFHAREQYLLSLYRPMQSDIRYYESEGQYDIADEIEREMFAIDHELANLFALNGPNHKEL